MTTSSICQAAAIALAQCDILTPFTLVYGTSGFRCLAQKLKGVAVRIGILAALRSLVKKGDFVGVMITASHNPACDNGIKLVDPNGEMLDVEWESYVVEFMRRGSSTVSDWLHSQLTLSDASISSHVVVGHDTRESSPSLAVEVMQGVKLMHGLCTNMGVVTTPQLHFTVKLLNDSIHSGSNRNLERPVLDLVYTRQFAARFTAGLNTLTPMGNGELPGVIDLHVDCAHGVGSLALASLADALIDLGGSRRLRLHLYNTETHKMELLNSNCGADFVKLTHQAPMLYSSNQTALSPSPTDRWATIDGDADRVLYFYHAQPHGDAAAPCPPIVLLDGDRIACLFASFLTRQLAGTMGLHLSVGVVQTAYANAASTRFLLNQLRVSVVCVPTGVKHLHRAAHQFDFGIYFEANGHGTVVYSAAALEHVQNLDSQTPLAVFVSLTNTAVGDAITDILMVEYALAWHAWSLADWYNLYTELPSRQVKVSVDEPARIRTMDAERRVAQPPELQTSIDELISSVDEATHSHGMSRAFVRPSGTENIVRVYAESVSQPWVDWLAQKVAILTHSLAGGTGPPLADPGPMP